MNNTNNNTSSIIVKRIRSKPKGQPIGILLACKVNGKVGIGWSLCCKRDTFDLEKGKMIARNRAEKYAEVGSLNNVPHTIFKEMEQFTHRCNRYYKDVNAVTSFLR